jgi:protein required for attachment to host cells
MATMDNVPIPNSALVLVSDGRSARFLRNRGTTAHPELVLEHSLDAAENPPTHEQGTDRPGRKPAPDRHSHSAIEQTDYHQQAEQRFAALVADTLYRMEHARQFDDLVVVAPPKMLGDLRMRLHPEVAQCVVGEIAKDLTNITVPEIGRLLS